MGAVGGKGGDGISGMGENGGADTTTPAESGESVGANAGGTGSTGYWFNGGRVIDTDRKYYTQDKVSSSSTKITLNSDNPTYTISGYQSATFNSATGTWTLSNSGSVTYNFPFYREYYSYFYSGSLTEIRSVYPYRSDTVNIETTQYKATEHHEYTYTKAWGKCYGGAGGGGASGSAAGGNPASPHSQTTRTGGTGASGGSRDAATIYGKGGDGGHGGGGGGGGGGSAIWTHRNASSYTCAAGVGGAGGAGGSGGAGAPGCIILYYRRPVTE